MRRTTSVIIGIVIFLSGLTIGYPALKLGNTGMDCGCNQSTMGTSKISNIGGYPLMQHPIYVDLDTINFTLSQTPLKTIPEEFSWKDNQGYDWMTPARYQGSCGSCWDFAALGSLESRIKIQEGCAALNPDLSEQYVLSCLPAAANTYGKGCWGGNPYLALYYIMDNSSEGNNCNGVILESCFRYQASHDIPCESKCDQWQDFLVPLKNCSDNWLGFDNPITRDILKSQILTGGPVSAAMNVTQDFVQFWELHHNPDDYYPDTNEPWDEMLNHIIVILGWKDDPSISNGGYWICKNSWGKNWGYNGFFNIEYGGLFTGFYIAWADYDPDSYDWTPVADAGGLYHGEIQEDLLFDGSASVDAEGPIVSYYWDFGDGANATGVKPSHAYLEEGIYVVTLTVFDDKNNTANDTTLAGIGEEPLRISLFGGLGIHVNIKNPTRYHLDDLSWSSYTQGLVYPRQNEGMIEVLSSNNDVTFILPVFGFGLGKITISLENIPIIRYFFIFGPFVKILHLIMG